MELLGYQLRIFNAEDCNHKDKTYSWPNLFHQALYHFAGDATNVKLERATVLTNQTRLRDLSQSEYCDKYFGHEWLSAWNATAKRVCQPNKHEEGVSSMTCRSLQLGKEESVQGLTVP